jgi:hypothetical protein
VRLTFVCKDPSSRTDDDCPAFYQTDRGTWVVQGWRITDRDVRDQLRNLAEDETYLEIPDGLVRLLVDMHGKGEA